MKREAAIDIGTNTMLILVADIASGNGGGPLRRIVKVHDDRINFVRLGQGVHQNRRFAPEAMERALKVFREYREICDRHDVKTIHACATSASRDAANSGEFYERVQRETGIGVSIVEGKTEARLSFLGGLLPSQDASAVAILDIGGGSTEFVVLSDDRRSVRGQSMDMGCVRATEMFLRGDPYDPASVEAMVKHLRGVWPELDPGLQQQLRMKEWTGIAGTPTTLAGIAQGMKEFDSAALDGYRLTRAEAERLRDKLARQTQAERASDPLISSGRADVIVAGVAILLTAMEFFGKDHVVVSSRGLRHGILLDPPPRPGN